MQSLCDVHGVAHDRVSGLHFSRERTGDDGTRVHTDAQGETDPAVALGTFVQTRDRAMHVERGADRAFGIILVGQWSAEDRHYGVAGVLVDRPTVPLDDVREGIEERREDGAQLLGIEALGQRGRSGQICEDDGDKLALFFALDRSDLERWPARCTMLLHARDFTPVTASPGRPHAASRPASATRP